MQDDDSQAVNVRTVHEEELQQWLDTVLEHSNSVDDQSKRAVAYGPEAFTRVVKLNGPNGVEFVIRLNSKRQAKHKKGTKDDTAQYHDVIELEPPLNPDRFNFGRVRSEEVLLCDVVLPRDGPVLVSEHSMHELGPHRGLESCSGGTSIDVGGASNLSSSTAAVATENLRSSYQVLVNKFPLGRGHAMLASQNILPQVLTLQHLCAARSFVVHVTPMWCLFYNSWSAGASVNHFHFQSFPLQHMPLLKRNCRCVWRNAASQPGPRVECDGACGRSYPAPFTHFGLDDVGECYAAIQRIIALQVPHNLVVYRGGVLLFKRTADLELRRRARETYGGYAAALECCGVFTAASTELLERLSFDVLAEMMRETTIP